MFGQIVVNITRKTVLIAGLIWAAEYGVLSLIEDSPELLKAATVICALLGLALVEAWDHARHGYFRLLVSLSVLLGVIYAGFVGYALRQAAVRSQKEARLEEFVLAGDKLLERKVTTNATNRGQFDDAELEQWRRDSNQWENETAQWLLINLGSTARSRFKDLSGIPTSCWSPGDTFFACDPRAGFMNRVMAEQKNLESILELKKIYGLE